MPPPPPELMDELVEEVLLCFPPHEPAWLLRAALVCKRWRRLVSDPGFRRRFRELHPTPPMLGFLCNLHDESKFPVARFVPAAAPSSCSPPCAAAADHRCWRADDARHGRVLLSRGTWHHVKFMVWDPVTDQRQELPAMPVPDQRQELPVMPRALYGWRAAILCAAAGGTCDHIHCHRHGHFLVVYVCAGGDDTFTCIYSSSAGTWSKPVSTHLPRDAGKNLVQSVLVGKALYFMFHKSNEVLEYDLELCRVVSVIQLPPYSNFHRLVLMTTEDGGLGFATVLDNKLYLWSGTGNVDSKGDAGWSQRKVINLERLLCIDSVSVPAVVGFADGVGVIFVKLNDVFFAIDLKTHKATEVHKGTNIYGIVPYMGFYSTPALEEPGQPRDQAQVT